MISFITILVEAQTGSNIPSLTHFPTMAAELTSSGVSQPAGLQASSDGSHLTVDTEVAFVFFNVGISNSELLGKCWNSKGSIKQDRLRNYIHGIFAPEHGIQALFISEFGQMSPTIDEELACSLNRGVSQPATTTYFENMLESLGLSHLNVHSLPPYVALVDPNYWHVRECVRCDGLCSHPDHFAMRLLLQHRINMTRSISISISINIMHRHCLCSLLI